jgi:hypothetical protein
MPIDKGEADNAQLIHALLATGLAIPLYGGRERDNLLPTQ